LAHYSRLKSASIKKTAGAFLIAGICKRLIKRAGRKTAITFAPRLEARLTRWYRLDPDGWKTEKAKANALFIYFFNLW
jgi:hypothetical protein